MPGRWEEFLAEEEVHAPRREYGCLFCVKRGIHGVCFTVIGFWIVEEYVGGRRVRIECYNRRYQSKTGAFRAEKS